MKSFLNSILTFLIFILICLLCVSFCVKDIIISTLSKEVVKNEVSNKIIESLENTYDDVDYDTLEKIETNVGNSLELINITEKYFDNIVDSIISEKDVELPDTKEDILLLIEENQSVLEESGIVVTDDQKNKIVDELTKDGKMDKIYKNVANNIKKDLSNEELSLVKNYKNITSPTFRWLVIGIIAIFILLTGLLKKSYYGWTYNLAVSLALSGITLSLLIPLLMDFITTNLTEKLIGKASSININPMINFGYLCLCLCAFFIIVYLVGNKISKNNYKKYN